MGEKAAVKQVSDKAGAGKALAEKVQEKVAERRRALGRGLESLLPGPRAVPAVAHSVPAPATAHNMPGSAAPHNAQVPAAAHNPSVQPIAHSGPAPVPAQSVPPATAHSVAARVVALPDDGVDGLAGAPVASPALGLATGPVPGAPLAGAVDLMASSEPSEGSIPGEASKAGSGSGAGRAMTAATPSAAEVANRALSGDEVLRLALDLIDGNPHQTRRRFREAALNELAESIRVQGVVQPIVVRAGTEGRYTLILGERRLRASMIAGMETIPAIVKRVSEQQAAEMTLVENLQRQDLNCVEQAEAFQNLSQRFNLTQEEIGKRVGMSRETVANYMRVLSLPEGVREALIGGKLTFSHARALLQLNTGSHELMWAYAKKAMDEKMSVAKLEDLVMGVRAQRAAGHGGGARWVDPNVKAAQRSLEEVLGMRVRIRDRNGRGKILIEYSTVDDFQRVVEMLGGK